MSVMEMVGSSLDGWAIERLEAEITLVAAHLAAGECRWLQLVAEFDRREAWASWGCASAADWLNFRCSIDMGAARERVRVARRLGELPAVTAAFSVGELSYSKVRALTRVATPANEELLVGLARCMTASQVERTVRCYRLAGRASDEADRADEAGAGETGTDPAEKDLYADRFLSTQWNDDGTLSIRAKLPPVEGELVMAALRRASDLLYRDRHTTHAAGGAGAAEDVSAETAHGHHGDPGDAHGPLDVSAETADNERNAEVDTSDEPLDSWGARQADALVALAETVVTDGLRPGSGPNRHTVVIHTTIADLQNDPDNDQGGHVDNGPPLPGGTVRRLMCDSSRTFVLEDDDGAVINVSRKAASIPSALARAVKLRDRGCVFPGCTRHAYTDIHHIIHRADGGDNTLTNTATLCRPHHRLVHEGGFTMTTPGAGRFQFCRPDGTLISVQPITVARGDDWIRVENAEYGANPTEDSPVPDWDGRRPDYPHIIDVLLDADQRLRDQPHSNN